jgi:uncharacterized protein (UPF0276 family)
MIKDVCNIFLHTSFMSFANLGIGLSLRPAHLEEILRHNPPVDWFEIISENYMHFGGKPMETLERIMERYTVVQHGVNLAIGSPCPLDWEYLKQLKKLTKITKTPWLSDHLSWGRMKGAHYHDLLPLPYTKDVIEFVAERAKIIQDFLELPFALENLSSYVSFVESEMPEWEFYRLIVEKAGIFMMLDVNNIYVSSCNHGFNPHDYYNNLPLDKVIQIHLAGHRNMGNYLLDTHDQHVADAVWEIYADVYPKTQKASTLLEWDDHFLSFQDTWNEALKAKRFQQQLCLL